MSDTKYLVYTIPDRCRVCYSCVRECPAKAIRIENGQAAVIHSRCIACGNCIRVCSQNAKAYRKNTDEAFKLLEGPSKTAALLAPSFPAEFTEMEDCKEVIGILRRMGFDFVCEVAFGADLVAKAYSEIISDESAPRTISSDCPAIVEYVRLYHPELVDSLVPLVSPMEAMSKVVKSQYGPGLSTVFIGPCIGKKSDEHDVDLAITFAELRTMMNEAGIKRGNGLSGEFDPPLASRGRIFPVKRGLLQTLRIPEDLFEGNILVSEGRKNFPEAIAEFKDGYIADQHLQLLCCEGCIMGPGMSGKNHRFARRSRVAGYVRAQMHEMDHEAWEKDMKKYSGIDLTRKFLPKDARLEVPSEEAIINVLKEMGKNSEKDLLDCGACGYDSCRNHAIAVAQGLAEIDMCLPRSLEQLHKSVEDLNISNTKLAGMKQALHQSEKLAHMGQLSAGIAHELNNPLGVVVMYANILLDDCREEQMREDLELIVSQADRCKKIVGNLLNFARKNQLNLVKSGICRVITESINTLVIPAQINVSLDLPKEELYSKIDPDQFTQVLTNIYKNAVDVMPSGGTLNIRLHEKAGEFHIEVSDTGSGISPDDMNKLFTPFFTTKPIGSGTGLGLATSYGIIKMHKGRIDVKSNNDPANGQTGTSFVISLPIAD